MQKMATNQPDRVSQWIVVMYSVVDTSAFFSGSVKTSDEAAKASMSEHPVIIMA